MAGGRVAAAPEHRLCSICRAPMRTQTDGPQGASAAGSCCEAEHPASALLLAAQCCELCRTQVLPGAAAGARSFVQLLPTGMQPRVWCRCGALCDGACSEQCHAHVEAADGVASLHLPDCRCGHELT